MATSTILSVPAAAAAPDPVGAVASGNEHHPLGSRRRRRRRRRRRYLTVTLPATRNPYSIPVTLTRYHANGYAMP